MFMSRVPDDKIPPHVLNIIRKLHNPKEERVGDFSGRCKFCHSEDLWDDETAYGCNFCDKIDKHICNKCSNLTDNGYCIVCNSP